MTQEKQLEKISKQIVKEQPFLLWNLKELKQCFFKVAGFLKDFADMQMSADKKALQSFSKIFKAISLLMQGVEACMLRIKRIESKLW